MDIIIPALALAVLVVGIVFALKKKRSGSSVGGGPSNVNGGGREQDQRANDVVRLDSLGMSGTGISASVNSFTVHLHG